MATLFTNYVSKNQSPVINMTVEELQNLVEEINQHGYQFRSHLKKGHPVGTNKKIQGESTIIYKKAMSALASLCTQSEIYKYLDDQGITVVGGPAISFSSGTLGFEDDVRNLLEAIDKLINKMKGEP